MPVTKSVKKTLARSKKRAIFNLRAKKKAKEAIREFKKKSTAESLKKAYSRIDRAVKKNVFPKNKAARLKAQLATLLQKKTPPTSKKRVSGKKTAGTKMMKKK